MSSSGNGLAYHQTLCQWHCMEREIEVQLPLKALIEELKISKAKIYMAMRDSKDQVMRDMLPTVKACRK